jgi:TatD DNase family protein
MGKNNKKGPSEDVLILPNHPSHLVAPIIDTHTHILSTFVAYKQKYKDAKFDSVYEFVRGLYQGKKVAALVDVWCEAPVQRIWKEVADSAIAESDRAEKWGGLEYWFVMGAFQSRRLLEPSLCVIVPCPECRRCSSVSVWLNSNVCLE